MSEQEQPEDLVTFEEAGALCGVSASTFRRWERAGKLEGHMAFYEVSLSTGGTARVVSAAEVRAYQSERQDQESGRAGARAGRRAGGQARVQASGRAGGQARVQAGGRADEQTRTRMAELEAEITLQHESLAEAVSGLQVARARAAELEADHRATRSQLEALRVQQGASRQEAAEQAAALVASQTEGAVLREKVSQLQQRLEAEQQRRHEERKRMDEQLFSLQTSADTRISELQANADTRIAALQANMEARIAELQAANEQQLASHEQQMLRLVSELTARRDEATQMRQASERQQQREALLRWKTATTERERDFAVAALGELQKASVWQRLTWRAPALELTDSAAAADPPAAIVDVTQEGEEG